MISRAFGVLLIVVTVAAGAFVDIVWLLVGGIREVVHGFEAHPVNGDQIGWGAAHFLFSGIGIGAAVLLCIAWAALFFGRSPCRRPASSYPLSAMPRRKNP